MRENERKKGGRVVEAGGLSIQECVWLWAAVERERSAVTGAYSLLQGPETGEKQGKPRPEQR